MHSLYLTLAQCCSMEEKHNNRKKAQLFAPCFLCHNKSIQSYLLFSVWLIVQITHLNAWQLKRTTNLPRHYSKLLFQIYWTDMRYTWLSLMKYLQRKSVGQTTNAVCQNLEMNFMGEYRIRSSEKKLVWAKLQRDGLQRRLNFKACSKRKIKFRDEQTR